ncbi:YbaK/EbsC family protein [Ignatzschineria sp. LJL83]
MIQQHPAVLRVENFLKENHHPHLVTILDDSAQTAQEAADQLQCEVSQIAKSIVFHNLENDQAVLVIISGDKRVDEKRVAEELGISRKKLGKANADFVREKTGFVIGGVSPIGHIAECILMLDPSLKRFETIWAAAGHPYAVFQSSPEALQLLTQATWIDVAKA